jgi:hypothetical protein
MLGGSNMVGGTGGDWQGCFLMCATTATSEILPSVRAENMVYSPPLYLCIFRGLTVESSSWVLRGTKRLINGMVSSFLVS